MQIFKPDQIEEILTYISKQADGVKLEDTASGRSLTVLGEALPRDTRKNVVDFCGRLCERTGEVKATPYEPFRASPLLH